MGHALMIDPGQQTHQHYMSQYQVAYVVQRPRAAPRNRKFYCIVAVALSLLVSVGCSVAFALSYRKSAEVPEDGNIELQGLERSASDFERLPFLSESHSNLEPEFDDIFSRVYEERKDSEPPRIRSSRNESEDEISSSGSESEDEISSSGSESEDEISSSGSESEDNSSESSRNGVKECGSVSDQREEELYECGFVSAQSEEEVEEYEHVSSAYEYYGAQLAVPVESIGTTAISAQRHFSSSALAFTNPWRNSTMNSGILEQTIVETRSDDSYDNVPEYYLREID